MNELRTKHESRRVDMINSTLAQLGYQLEGPGSCEIIISFGTESPTHAPARPIHIVRYSSREHLNAAMVSAVMHG